MRARTQIVEQVRALGATYREVVLSGINLGRWGRESGSTHAPPRSAAAVAGRDRDRAPAPQFRRADGFLRRTARADGGIAAHRETRPCAAAIGLGRAFCAKCTANTARAIMRTASTKARALMPDAAIGADVMVGFPGETDELFEESRAVHRSACRSLTCTSSLTRSVRGRPPRRCRARCRCAVRKERNRVLRELANEKNLGFPEESAGQGVHRR